MNQFSGLLKENYMMNRERIFFKEVNTIYPKIKSKCCVAKIICQEVNAIYLKIQLKCCVGL